MILIVDLDRIKDIGVAAAARAGEILCHYWGKTHTVEKKGPINRRVYDRGVSKETLSIF